MIRKEELLLVGLMVAPSLSRHVVTKLLLRSDIATFT
jgi:hypothetical protein